MKTVKKRVLATLFLGLFQTLSAHAEDDRQMDQLLSMGLEELMALKVSISTNTSLSLFKAPSVVSVITAEDIKATGATNVTEVLQGVPGVYIRNNQFGFRPLLTIRGSAATHVLVMVNGAPIRDLVWSTGIFWKGLPTSMIERVEIIRGPGSALFGSDASAGVINIITKTAGTFKQAEAGVRAGSFDSQAAWAQFGSNWNGFDVGFTAEFSRTQGHRPFIAADGQTAKDRTFGTKVSLAPGNARYGWDGADLRFSLARENWRLQADYMGHGNVETGLTGANVLDQQTRGKDNRVNLALFYNNENFARDWGLNAELRYHHLDYSSGSGFQENPPGFRDASGSYPDGFINRLRSAEDRVSAELSGLYAGVRNHAIRLGGGHISQDLYFVEQFINKGKGRTGATLPAGGPLVDVSDSPYAFAPEKIRTVSYLFLQDVWTFAKAWELTAGARYDRYSDFGGTFNPRLALVWQSTDRLTTKLMYGKAFRAPSYQELYSLTAATMPNPDLKPERSNTWDLAFSLAASRNLKLGLNLYRFAQTNLIGSDAANKFQNIGDLTTRGVELEAHWQATGTLRFSGNLTRRSETDTPFRSYAVPKQQAYLRADWAFMPNWNWNVQASRIGKHELPAGDTRAPLNAYTLSDTTLRYSHRKEWEFAASMRNMFNVDAREYTSSSLPNYLPLPKRSFYAEIRFKY